MQILLTLDKINEVYFRLSFNDFSELRKIHEHFKVMIDGAKFSPRYQAGIWDGKISPIDLRTQTVPIGLWKQILEYCQVNDIKYKFLNMDPTELFKDDFFSQSFIDKYTETQIEETLPFCLRENQKLAVYYAMQYKKCILLLATGFGKSIVIYELIRLLYATSRADRIMLVVPNINLVNQIRSNFIDDYFWEECDDKCYLLSGETKPKDKIEISKNEINKPILITTWQSIIRKSEPWFKQWDALIIDETHGVTNSGTSLQNISKKCTEARYKIGLTGTLSDSLIDYQTAIGYVGPVAYVVKSNELIKEGVLSKIQIYNYIIRYNEETSLKGLSKDYHAEIELIESLPERMTIISDIIKRNDSDENFLVLAKHVKHMKEIEEYLKTNLDSKYTVKRIDGTIKGSIREDIRIEMTDSKNFILVASFATASTGINIPKLHNVIFAASYKGKIKVLQAIGRGLRLHKTKDGAKLFDLVDDFSEIQKTGRRIHKNHVYKHFEQRKLFYDIEQFPYENFDIKI